MNVNLNRRAGNRKSRREIEKMRVAGRIVWQAHRQAARRVVAGATTAEIDAVVDDVIANAGAEALFKGHHPPNAPTAFPAATCISVNDEVVHGIPGERKLEEGDVVSLDIGVRKDGWCGDAAVTHAVGEISTDRRTLLEVTEGALRIALEHMRPNIRWSRVAKRMQQHVRAAGLAVIEDLVGHGIGRQLWEPPQVANYVRPGGDFRLRPGMVLAVEPMVTMESPEVKLMPDHWTFCSVDGRAAAHFEHTIAITQSGAEALTVGPDGEGWAIA